MLGLESGGELGFFFVVNTCLCISGKSWVDVMAYSCPDSVTPLLDLSAYFLGALDSCGRGCGSVPCKTGTLECRFLDVGQTGVFCLYGRVGFTDEKRRLNESLTSDGPVVRRSPSVSIIEAGPDRLGGRPRYWHVGTTYLTGPGDIHVYHSHRWVPLSSNTMIASPFLIPSDWCVCT